MTRQQVGAGGPRWGGLFRWRILERANNHLAQRDGNAVQRSQCRIAVLPGFESRKGGLVDPGALGQCRERQSLTFPFFFERRHDLVKEQQLTERHEFLVPAFRQELLGSRFFTLVALAVGAQLGRGFGGRWRFSARVLDHRLLCYPKNFRSRSSKP